MYMKHVLPTRFCFCLLSLAKKVATFFNYTELANGDQNLWVEDWFTNVIQFWKFKSFGNTEFIVEDIFLIFYQNHT